MFSVVRVHHPRKLITIHFNTWKKCNFNAICVKKLNMILNWMDYKFIEMLSEWHSSFVLIGTILINFRFVWRLMQRAEIGTIILVLLIEVINVSNHFLHHSRIGPLRCTKPGWNSATSISSCKQFIALNVVAATLFMLKLK